MTVQVPRNPWIYHITHVSNLTAILTVGGLWSDAQIRAGNASATNVGYAHIKARRMSRQVLCAARGVVGDYVPFYFCPRSVMLYVLHRGHEGYQGGQRDIVHLVSSVNAAIAPGRPWFFTDRHADLGYAQQFASLDRLDQVSWDVMSERRWGNDDDLKQRRQAEFLVHEFFPWSAVLGIGVHDEEVAVKVRAVVAQATPKSGVHTRRNWYY
ncbi:MAG: DUF4433 domain-containing protein [Deltaproteobacteria bacterium]|nr:DUF4433 domain-containing protein [Deltaproteobacteria bacterium]